MPLLRVFRRSLRIPDGKHDRAFSSFAGVGVIIGFPPGLIVANPGLIKFADRLIGISTRDPDFL